MIEKTIPPFYENFDGTHCYQCSLRGVLENFEPEKKWSWEELDKFCNKIEGKWTWPQRSFINLIARGYDIKVISDWDNQEFINVGYEKYLTQRLGEEAAQKQIENADMPEVYADVKDLLKNNKFSPVFKIPTFEDVYDLLRNGYLVMSSLNSAKLDKEEGYSSHIVVVYGADDEYVYFHDSGLPAVPERKELIADFVMASCSPNQNQWLMIGVKK